MKRGRIVADLVLEKVLFVGTDGRLLTRWTDGTDTPEIFKTLQATSGERDQGDAFIRWQVREPGNTCTAVWEDDSLQEAWAGYDASVREARGMCMVSGDLDASLSLSHPKRIRHPGDGAKLISANDGSGYTFRGRFTDDNGLQACGVSHQVSQMAHNALRWLIQRQGFRNDEQAIVAWAVGGSEIPDLFGDSFTLLFAGGDPGTLNPATGASSSSEDIDVGQAFATRLNARLVGYRSNVGATDVIVIIALDSATPGRLAITYYRELTGSEFLDRVGRREKFAPALKRDWERSLVRARPRSWRA